MKKYIYLLCVLSFVLTACRDDKFGSEESSGSAALKLKFNTSNNMSRAVSSDEEERRIQNAYVFIFNQDGTKVFGRFYDGINQQNTYQIEIKDIPAGSDKTIAVIANINTAIFRPDDSGPGGDNHATRFTGIDFPYARLVHREGVPIPDERNDNCRLNC